MRKWLPYADLTRSDVWSDISNAIPTPHGMYRSAPGFLGSGTGTGVSDSILNAYQLELPTGAYTNVAAMVEHLFTWSAGTFTDRTKVGGYSASGTHWSVVQFGVYTVATNGFNPPQVRDGTGGSAFADLAGSPPSTAKFAVVQSNTLLLFNTNTGGQYWVASVPGNHADFTGTESVAATAINHRPGAITAAVAFRDEVIVFKENSCFRMRYVGLPVVWTVELISAAHGAMGPGSIANCGDFLAVADYKNGGYLFDGSGFQRIDEGIKPFLVTSVVAPVAGQYFKNQESIWWNVDTRACVTYNLQSRAWGKFTVNNPDAQNDLVALHRLMVGQGIYDELRGATFVGNDTNYPIVSSFAEDEAAGSNNTAIDGYVTTGLFGQQGAMTMVSAVVPLLKVPDSVIGTTNVPTAASMTMTPYTQTNPEGTASSGSNVACSTTAQKRFDYQKSAQWHKFKIAFANTTFEIDDVLVTSPARVSGPRTAGVSP